MALRKPGLEAEANKEGFGLCVLKKKKKKVLLRLVFPLYYAHSICQEQILRSVSHCIGEMRLAEFRAPKLSNLE